MKNQLIVGMVSVPSLKVARLLAKVLVESKTAACVSIVPSVESHYCWKGKMERSRELLLLIKTRPNCWENLCQIIKEKHPYDVPELIAGKASRVNASYARWVFSQTQKSFARAKIPKSGKF